MNPVLQQSQQRLSPERPDWAVTWPPNKVPCRSHPLMQQYSERAAVICFDDARSYNSGNSWILTPYVATGTFKMADMAESQAECSL